MKLEWSTFKTELNNKNAELQYIEYNTYYQLYFYDQQSFFECSITNKSTAISGSDQEDFENNYKSSANQILAPIRVIHEPELFNNIIYKDVPLVNGSNENMNVDGSTSNVDFIYQPSSGIKYLDVISLFIQDPGVANPNNFGSLNELANGLQILIKSEGVEYEIMNLKNNIHIVHSFPGKELNIQKTFFDDDDIYLGHKKYNKPMKMSNSSGDYIIVKVRDNLTTLENLRIGITIWEKI